MSKRGRKAKVVNFKKNTEVDLEDVSVTIEQPKILFLPITLEECTGNLYGQKIKDFYEQVGFLKGVDESINLKEFKNEMKSYVEYDSNCNKVDTDVYESRVLPVSDKVDTANQVLNVKTNVACWNCCHTFESYPICAPVSYNPFKDIFKVTGCFCSFNCSKAYIMSELRYKNIHLHSQLIKRIMKEMHSVKPSPPKTVLKLFGGPLTIEEYRETFTTLNTVDTIVSPMIFMPMQIEHKKVTNLAKENMDNIKRGKSKTNNISRKSVEKAQERLYSKKEEISEKSLINLMNLRIE